MKTRLNSLHLLVAGIITSLDYLVEEVLNCQPEPLKEFLLQTSILERLSGPLCDAVTGRADGQTTLEQLEKANLFISPLGGECCWYRYHHLFRDVVRNRFRLSDSGKLPELYRRAADWHLQNEMIVEAVNYAQAGGDQAQAALLIERCAWQMIMSGELAKLASSIQAVEEFLPARPWLNIYLAWVLLLSNQLMSMEKHLQIAERILTSSGTDHDEYQKLQAHIRMIRVYAAVVIHNDPNGIHLTLDLLKDLPKDDPALQCVSHYVLGTAYDYCGDIDRCVQTYYEAAQIGRNNGNVQMAVLSYCSLAENLRDQGILNQAVRIIREAAEYVSQNPHRFNLGITSVYLLQGVFQYERNEIDSAEELVRKSLELNKILGITEYSCGGKIYLARVFQARGEREQARELMQEAAQYPIRSTLGPEILASLSANWMRIYLDDGDLEAARKLAQERGLGLDVPIDFSRIHEYCVFTRLILAQGMPGAALAFADRILRQAEAHGIFGWAIKAQALKALALRDTGDLPGALDSLEKALKLAKPEGFVRTFLDEGEPMVKLLRQAKNKGIETQYVTKLLQGYARYSPVATPISQPLIEPLSKRELEVLRLIADGCSNKEIASRLFITISTVKRHTVTIFQKLDVENRTQAVAQARELKLL